MSHTTLPDDADRFRHALESLVGIPTTEGNHVSVLRNGDEIFPAMLDAIRDAEHTIDLLTYVYWTGEPAREFARLLSERARGGLRVRVLLDAVGTRSMDKDLVEQMRSAGVLVELFRPVSSGKVWRNSHRTHRRALVCDGRVAFTGGVGISEEWQGDARNPGEWRDTHLRVVGPAVDGIRAAFLDNWAETGHPLLDPDERFPHHPTDGSDHVMVVRSSAGHGVATMSILKRVLIDLAEHRVRITSAYLAPDEGAMEALAAACERGVKVQILVPGEHADKRVARAAAESHYSALLDIGVELHTYERSMLHAKTMTVDGAVADIGSANFNARSLSQDEEIDVVLFTPETVATIDAHFEDDLAHAQLVTEERWQERGMLQRAKEGVVGLADDVM